MLKKEFDKRISEIADDVISRYSWRSGFLCSKLETISTGARDIFTDVFYRESPGFGSGCNGWGVTGAWLCIDSEGLFVSYRPDYAMNNQLRLEFLYRFWDYCVSRKLYRKW